MVSSSADLFRTDLLAPATGADVAGIPVLDDLQLGHIRHIENLSLQLENDWSHMMGRNPLQEDFGAFRFQLAYMAYALALAHVHYLPAAPGFFKNTFDRLIQKMLHPEVWLYWRDVSKGGNFLALDAPRSEGCLDPVAKDNIMYSAYVQSMTLLYNYLFNDDKYAKPGAISFRFEPIFFKFDQHEVFSYDQNSLNQRVYWNMVENGYLGVACEPYCVFLICNQIPILGFRLHDLLTGGSTATEVTQGYLNAWKEFGGFLDKDGRFNTMMRWHTQDVVPGSDNAWVSAWCGTLMNAWHRDFVREHYPRQITECVVAGPDGTLTVPFRKMPPGTPPALMRLEGSSSDFGWVATWASEMGDRSTLDALLAHADRFMNPKWDNGGYYYPRNDQEVDDDGNRTFVTPLEGNALLAYARLNVSDGLWTIYNKPWNKDHFTEPALEHISSNLDVLRAWFDASGQSLTFTLRRRRGSNGEASVLISNVWERGAWELRREGTVVASDEPARALGSATTLRAVREHQYLRLTTDLQHETTFTLVWK